MKLQLKHLAPYLPHKLKMIFEGKGGRIIELSSLSFNTLGETFSDGRGGMWLDRSGFKPILQPFSYLKEDDVLQYFKHYDQVIIENSTILLNGKGMNSLFFEIHNLPFDFTQKLFEQHIDVFGLIEKGLAVDINTLKP